MGPRTKTKLFSQFLFFSTIYQMQEDEFENLFLIEVNGMRTPHPVMHNYLIKRGGAGLASLLDLAYKSNIRMGS